MHGIYLSCFLLGYLCSTMPDFWRSLAKHCCWLLMLALCSYLGLLSLIVVFIYWLEPQVGADLLEFSLFLMLTLLGCYFLIEGQRALKGMRVGNRVAVNG